MTMKTFFTPVLMLTVLALAGCASPSPEARGTRTADDEVKRLEDQAAGIMAQIKETTTVGKDKMLRGDEVSIQIWKRDKTTPFPGFPLKQVLPESGILFVPGVGLTEIGGKTDGEIETVLSDYFSKTVVDPTLKILPGDEVTIQVWRRDKTTQFTGFPLLQKVPDSGRVFIPGIGQTDMGGKTDGEIQTALFDHFSRILVEPTVIVSHKGGAPVQQDSQPIIVVSHERKTAEGAKSQKYGRVVLMGWANAQGLYSLEEPLTVRDLIAKAGGFGEYANKRRVYVVRGNPRDPEIIVVNVYRMFVGKDLETNILLQPNDAVYVPPVEMWKIYDVVRKILLPVSAVRDTLFTSTEPPIKP